MIFELDDVRLRRPEPQDIEALYAQKNDPEVANQLGGFAFGLSRADVGEWIERHRKLHNEIVWTIASVEGDRCLGHVGLYNIDQRVRLAEFAIMLADTAWQGRGIGKRVTRFVVRYGFEMLNLNRIELTFLSANTRARRLYTGLGFKHEGTRREAQYKSGAYIDVELMALLRREWLDAT